jgi:hypothetical protein
MPTRQHVVETFKDGKLVGTQTVTYDVPQEQVNDETIRDRAVAALATNKAFIDSAKPGTAAAQASAAYDQTKALTRQVNGLIRLVLGRLDGTD